MLNRIRKYRNIGDEEIMGRYGAGTRNKEGSMVVDFGKRMDLAIVNTYFKKKDEHRVTYKSGGKSTQVDYVMCRRRNLKEMCDCKVILNECVAKQHRIVVCKMALMVKKKKAEKVKPKIRWWKLKETSCQEAFRQEVTRILGGKDGLPDEWDKTAEMLRKTAETVLGVTFGKRKGDRETWWWNEEVQKSIKEKKEAKKAWDKIRNENTKKIYKEKKSKAKKAVAMAKGWAYDNLYARLKTKEGEKELYKLARQRNRAGKDVQHVRVIKDENGNVMVNSEAVLKRWKEYFEKLMNEENNRDPRTEEAEVVNEEVNCVSREEVKNALRRMKKGKAVGPDELPVEVWKCMGEMGIKFLTRLFNRLLMGERMPEEWRRSVLIPIYKNKGDAQCCGNYRVIKLMSHTMKVWERIIEARLRDRVEISKQQYGFMPGKGTTDAMFALRMLMEKYREGQRELHCVFVDLEKAYDRVPREELWYCMRKSGIVEKYVQLVHDMYEGSETVVRCAVGTTKSFKVKVGLHQGSALSPFLFAVIMDRLTDEVRREAPWTMLFADDIVICEETREEVEQRLESWKYALERRGMKVSRSKTEYLCINGGNDDETVKMEDAKVPRVKEFKYLGSTVQESGGCEREVKKRVQAGWNGWRRVSGVICDRRLPARVKGKVYSSMVRPAMVYGLETVAVTKKQVEEMEVAEMKMLRFAMGVTRKDKIRNENIRSTVKVEQLGMKMREGRLRWYGHVMRRDQEYVGRKMMEMELPGKRRRGRPKRRFLDAVKEDMQEVGVKETDVEDRKMWRMMIRCGHP